MEAPALSRNVSFTGSSHKNPTMIRRMNTFHGTENPTMAASLARVFVKGCKQPGLQDRSTGEDSTCNIESNVAEEESAYVTTEEVSEPVSTHVDDNIESAVKPHEHVKRTKVGRKYSTKKNATKRQKRPTSASIRTKTTPSHVKHAVQPPRQKYSRADLSWARMKTMQFIRSGAGTTEEAERREVYDYDPESTSFSQVSLLDKISAPLLWHLVIYRSDIVLLIYFGIRERKQ